jgi:MFS family permease
MLTRNTTLLLATGILLIGHGLQLTLLPVHALTVGWSSSEIGVTGSAYFLGFVAGCWLIPGIVSQVGHIRSFMVMAAVATVALLGAALFVRVPAWILFRFATGFALSGLYMVIESWLNEVNAKDRKGAVLAVYTVISLTAMAVGQLLMTVSVPDDFRLFLVAAILLSIAIVPIGLTHVRSPEPIPAIRVTPRTLMRGSRVAVVCALLAGMVTGAFWTLGPLLGAAFELDAGRVGVMMSLGIAGGALSQLPVGHLSDRSDRRVVIGGVACVGAIVAYLGFLFVQGGSLGLYTTMFFLGATSMPIYALCIAHASDNTDLSLVEITSGILMVHSVGSIMGPIAVSALMARFGPASYFTYCLVCLLSASVWSFYRHFAVEQPREGKVHAILLPRTTQAVAEIAPSDVSDRDTPGTDDNDFSA